MGVGASGATLEIQLVADVARLQRDMATMQQTIASATTGATQSFSRMATGTGAAATAMAVAAQSSARAAVGLAGGMRTATGAMQNANIVSLELFHVTRSVTEQLAMGVSPARAFGMEIGRIATAVQYSGGSVRGLITQFAAFAGIIKVTQNAELAEAAAQKLAISEAVRSRAERAASAVVARQAQVAIAQAQLAAATSAEAEAAAQAQLVKALRAVEVAATQAAIAQRALAGASAEAAEAAAAASAASKTTIGTTGVLLAAVAVPLAVGYVALKRFQDQVKDSGELTSFRNNLGLTHQEMLRLSDGVVKVGGNIKDLGDVTVTTGDVLRGLWKTIQDGASSSSGSKTWDALKADASKAFSGILEAWSVVADGITAGILGTYNAVKIIWGQFPAAFGDLFVQGVNAAITALNALVKHGTDLLNGFINAADKIPGVNIGNVAAPQIGLLNNPNAGAAEKAVSGLGTVYQKAYAEAKQADKAFWDQVKKNALQSAKDRMTAEANALKEDRRPKRGKKPNDHGLAEALAELDAQIRGQLNLARAYLVSDAAAIKAEALQKAEEDAIKHKSETGVFYEKELAKAVATGAAEGAKKLAQLRDETTIRKAVNDNVAAGTLSYRDMNQAMQDQVALQPLLTLQSIATGEAYKIITEVIERYRQALADAHAEEHRGQALEELGRLNEQHQQTMALLEQESQLTGVQKDRRDEILKLLKQELELRAQFPGMTQDEINKVVAQTAAEDALRRHLDQVEAGMDQLRQTGEQMIDTVFNIDNWKDPLDLALQLVKQLEQSFVTLGFANPLKNMLYGENLPTLDSVGGVGGFFKGIAGAGKNPTVALSAAGTTLSTAGTALNTAALALQQAAVALGTAATASGGSSIFSSLLGGIGNSIPESSLLGAMSTSGLDAGVASSLSFSGGSLESIMAGLPGLAGGGTFAVGGRGGTDRNIISINGMPRARVGADEIVAVIPKDQFGGGANLPGMKGGGLLGALSFLSPALFLQQHHLLKYLSPAAFLLDQFKGDGAGGALKYLSPAALAGSALFGKDGDKNGHTFHINVNSPNTGNAAKDRQTSLQQATDIRMAIAGAATKGLI